LNVTVYYSDSTTAHVGASDYTLTGTIREGTNVITVTYSGKTTTFTVEGIATPADIVLGSVTSGTIVLWSASNTATSWVVPYADSVKVVNGVVTLVSPKTITLYKSTESGYASNNYSVLLGKYVKLEGSATTCYYIAADSTYQHNKPNSAYISETIVYSKTQTVTVAG
jgi:hypothetical protein